MTFFHRFASQPPFQDRSARVATASAILVLALHCLFIIRFVAVRIGTLSFLRLHYTTAIGVDWVAEWWYIFSFPLLGLVTLLVNLWLATVLARRRAALGVLMLVATVVLEILLAAGGLIAMLLNA